MPVLPRGVRIVQLTVGICAALASGAEPARAIDCDKATTPVENAICSSDVLTRADDALNDAYTALADRLSGDALQGLRQTQRQWLKRRSWCESTDQPIAECILRETIDRTYVLAGRPHAGPGPDAHLSPEFVARLGSPTLYELDVTVLKFPEPATPGHEAFNAEVDQLLKEVPTNAVEQAEGASQVYAYQLTMSLPYASPSFMSATVFTFEYSGGAHGNSSTRNINVDLRAASTMTFDSLFEKSAGPILAQSCFHQIQKLKQQRQGNATPDKAKSDEDRRIVQDVIAQLVNWTFTGAGATVTFDPHVIGAFAEGRYECKFDLDFLQALVTPGSPLASDPVTR